MAITKRNHYNPCFWTAFWNYNYYHDEKYRGLNKARAQKVYSLNLKGDKILQTTVDKLFYEKKMGLTEVSFDAYLSFTKNYMPDEYNRIINDPESFFCNYIIDIENFFAFMDEYHLDTVINIVSKNEINTIEEKSYVALYIIDLMVRNYRNFLNILAFSEEKNISKIEAFWHFRNDLSNPQFLNHLVSPLMISKWVIYKSELFKYPLSDVPIMLEKENLLVPLSPKMLLKIDFQKRTKPESKCFVKEKMSKGEYKEFMKRTIQNAHREIIFSDKDVLRKWKETKIYRKRVNELFGENIS